MSPAPSTTSEELKLGTQACLGNFFPTVKNTALHAKFQAADVLMSIAVACLLLYVPLKTNKRHAS